MPKFILTEWQVKNNSIPMSQTNAFRVCEMKFCIGLGEITRLAIGFRCRDSESKHPEGGSWFWKQFTEFNFNWNSNFQPNRLNWFSSNFSEYQRVLFKQESKLGFPRICLLIWAVDILFRKNLNSYNWKFITYHQLETSDGAAGGRTITLFGDRWCAAVSHSETYLSYKQTSTQPR